ncbi:16367_t:CDS:1, partial [Racocetra persica]
KHSKNLSNSIKSIKSSNKKQKTQSEKHTKTSLIWKYFEETKVRDND